MIFLLVFLALCFSAFFSGSEIAYISASKISVELKRKTGSRRGRILSGFFDKPDQFLGIMLVGNNIALVAFTILLKKLIDPTLLLLTSSTVALALINTLFGTIIVLILGEYLPKTIFRLYSDALLHFFTYPLAFFKYLLGVPAWFMTKTSNLFLKHVLGMPISRETKVFTRLDLADFVDVKLKGSEDEMEADLFKNALHLKTIKVRECMIPRMEIAHIDINANYDDYLKLFNKTHLSRILVTDEEIDQVLGYVHHLQFLDQMSNIKDVINEIPFVPEAMNVQDLLRRFMKDKTTIACVVDEYGGVSGIITMEDILEELFGEIEDEHDAEGYVELKLNDKEFLFSGRHEVDYLNDKYEEINIPTGDYTTLSGYLVLTTNTIPEEGDEIVLDNYKFIIVQVSDTKIETIRVLIDY